MLIFYVLLLLVLWSCSASGSLTLTLGLGLSVGLQADYASLSFAFTLIIISSTVIVWSYYYLDTRISYRNFLGVLFSFLFSIFGLIFVSDIMSLLVFWDLLGFTSFYLVIYYRTRAAISSRLLTGLTNRIGDCLLLLFFSFSFFGGRSPLLTISFLLLIVSFTKSAQFPFSVWLPAAMSAPTPVSALVHSSTLVTAGVYLLFRFLHLNYTLLLRTGVLTTFLAGLAAFFESDFKKIIALSTLSQLGIIITGLGLEQRSLRFVHLNLHARYKALLFIAVGILIHSIYGSQGFRKLGTLVASSSLVGVALLLACASICGLVFTSGWCSKDTILASAFRTCTPLLLVFFFYFGLVLTVAYSFRIVFWAASVHSAHLSFTSTLVLGPVLKWPLCCLSLLSILQGLLFPPLPTIFSTVLSS